MGRIPVRPLLQGVGSRFRCLATFFIFGGLWWAVSLCAPDLGYRVRVRFLATFFIFGGVWWAVFPCAPLFMQVIMQRACDQLQAAIGCRRLQIVVCPPVLKPAEAELAGHAQARSAQRLPLNASPMQSIHTWQVRCAGVMPAQQPCRALPGSPRGAGPRQSAHGWLGGAGVLARPA